MDDRKSSLNDGLNFCSVDDIVKICASVIWTGRFINAITFKEGKLEVLFANLNLKRPL